MTTKDKIKLIEKLIAAKTEMDKQVSAMAKLVGGGIYQEPLFTAVYKSFEVGIDAASIAVGDGCNWLSWYIWENECGEYGYNGGFGKRTRAIKTVKDLVWLIEGSK